METTGSATVHVRCGFLARQLQRVFSSFIPLPLQQPHNTRRISTQNNASLSGKITQNYQQHVLLVSCLILPRLKKWVPILWSLTVATHNGKATPQPSLHTPLHSSSSGKAAASSRLKGLCKELPNALRTPLRGRRFLNKQHPQAFKPAQRWGWGWNNPFPIFSYFEQGVSWLRGKRHGLKPWEFSPIVVEKPAFWFPGNFLTWQDWCELQQNRTETTADANGWRYSLDGWLEFCWKSILSNMVKSGTSWRLSGGSWWIEAWHHPEWY